MMVNAPLTEKHLNIAFFYIDSGIGLAMPYITPMIYFSYNSRRKQEGVLIKTLQIMVKANIAAVTGPEIYALFDSFYHEWLDIAKSNVKTHVAWTPITRDAVRIKAGVSSPNTGDNNNNYYNNNLVFDIFRW